MNLHFPFTDTITINFLNSGKDHFLLYPRGSIGKNSWAIFGLNYRFTSLFNSGSPYFHSCSYKSGKDLQSTYLVVIPAQVNASMLVLVRQNVSIICPPFSYFFFKAHHDIETILTSLF